MEDLVAALQHRTVQQLQLVARLHTELAHQGFPRPANSSDLDQMTLAYTEVSSWLTARAFGGPQPATVHGGPPGVDLAAIGRLVGQPDQVQAGWVRQREQTIHGVACA